MQTPDPKTTGTKRLAEHTSGSHQEIDPEYVNHIVIALNLPE